MRIKASIVLGASLLLRPGWGAAAEALRVCDDVSEPVSLDPFSVFSEKTHTLLQQVLEGLVRFDPDGRIEPALALEWERLDPLRTRFRLRKGVRFHNGEPFDASSVKFSLERYLDPETRFPGRGFLGPLERVEVVDPHTVELVTSRPDGALLNRLAAWVHLVPPAYYAAEGRKGFSRGPVGTGPFRFVSWTPGKGIELAAYEGYWEEGVPKSSRLSFLFLDRDRQVEALLGGEVDVLTDVPGTETFRVHTASRTRVDKRDSFYTVATSLRLDRPPLDDVRVRRALNYALDKQDLIRYDAKGNGEPIATLTFPGEFGHNARLRPYPYDPGKAKALLAEAGRRDGLRLKALVKVNAARTARIMARQWERVGIRVEPTFVSDADLLEAFQRGSFDLAIGDIPNPTAHAFFVQSIVIYSRSPFALGRYPEYDRRLEEVLSTVEPGRQRALLEELDAFIHERALSVFTYQRTKTYGVRRCVRIVPYVTGMPHFFRASKEGCHERQG